MTYTIAGEGDFCLDFLVPVVANSEKFQVIYREGVAPDTIVAERIDLFISIMTRDQVASVTEDKSFVEFYGLSRDAWPIAVPEMLAMLYAGARLGNVTVTVRGVDESLRSAAQAYLGLLEAKSDNDWSHVINSGSSNIYVSDTGGNECMVEHIVLANGRAVMKAGDLVLDPSFDGAVKVRFSGERAIIHQLEYGSPAYIPWYVRYSCNECPGKCQVSVPRFFTPIYDKTFKRCTALTAPSELQPWGLLHDLFDFAQPRIATAVSLGLQKAVAEWIPSRLEDVILRCALRETVAERRKRSAALDTVDGLARTFASCDLEVHSYRAFSEACGESRHLPQSFLAQLWILSGLRHLRKAIHSRDRLGIKKWITNREERVEVGYPYLSMSARMQIELVTRHLANGHDDSVTIENVHASILEFKRKPTPLGIAEFELRADLCEATLKSWGTLERALRVTPYKVFALLPYFQLLERDRAEPDSYTDLCLICCRRMRR